MSETEALFGVLRQSADAGCAAAIEGAGGMLYRSAEASMLSKNLLTPWTIDLFGRPVMVRQPHWTKRVWPVVVSISRQISFERSANGEYSTPSPTAARVNLVSPVDDPNSCGGL